MFNLTSVSNPDVRRVGQRAAAKVFASALSAATIAFVGLSTAHAQPTLTACGGKWLQQENGNWVYWGQSGTYGGFAGLTTTNVLQGLTNGATVHTRRLKAFESTFAAANNPTLKARSVFCSYNWATAHAILDDGTVVGWGNNSNGQIGNGDTVNKTTPAGVNLPIGYTAIAGGGAFTLALATNGTVAGWGANAYGQVGDGTTAASRPFPFTVAGLSSVKAIAAGQFHSIALLDDGTVRTWGRNNAGQLGTGNTTSRSTPGTVVGGLTNVVAVLAVLDSSYALRANGEVWAWGENFYGELGNGSSSNRSTPSVVAGLPAIQAMSSNGKGAIFALDTLGRVWGWGDNEAANTLLGESRTGCANRCLPAIVTGLPAGVTQIFGNQYETQIARTADGKLYGWGENFFNNMAQGRLNVTTAPYQWAVPRLLHQSVTPSDFDLDYSSDILFRNTSNGDVWLWSTKDSAISVSAGISNVTSDWKIVGTGDADGDGKADIFWRNSVTGENSLWLMDNRQFKGTIPLETVGDQNWVVAAIGDMNGDARADILWRNESAGLFSIWLMGETGIASTRAYGGVPSGWQVKGLADFNGDGNDDIIWREQTSGAVAIYRMNGIFIDGTNFLAGGLSEWEIVNVSDLDRDGYAEILLRYFTGAVLAKLDLNTAATAISTTAFIAAAGGDWQIAAVGDYDADTFPDFLWRNSAGELVIWRLVNLQLQAPTDVKFLGNPGNVWQVMK